MLNETLETIREYHKSLSEEYHRGYEQGKKDAQQWIPVSEKLPFAEYGESSTVYCYCYDEEHGGKWAEMLYFNGGVWCKRTGETFNYKVLAWYPLPIKPYREEI